MNWYDDFLEEEIFLARDASQFEIRMLAQYSKDRLLVKQLNAKEDIHSQVGHTIYGWSIDKIKKDKKTRTIVKQLHFGIIYGLQPKGIYETCLRLGLKVEQDEIEEAYNHYFAKYTGVADWIEEAIEYARRTSYTMPTLFGRTRPLVIDDSGDRQGAYWANIARNSPLQGSAVDFILLAMAIAWERREQYRLIVDTARMEVHDSFICTPKLKELDETDGLLQGLMEEEVIKEAAFRFGVEMVVPLLSEASAGFRLGSMVEYDRLKPLDDLLAAWVIRDLEIKAEFEKDPLRFVERSRGG